MKNKNNIYFLILLVFTIVSCDDFLDIKPVGKVIPSTAKDFREVLTDGYSKVPTDRSKASIRSDEMKLKKGWGDSHLSYISIFLWNDTKPDSHTKDFPWQQFYKVILDANQVIINGKNPKESNPEEVAQLQAEAYLLRAYMHFGLVNLYADIYTDANKGKKAIPLATTIDIWKNYEQNTISEVYTQIIKDIETGIKNMKVEKQNLNKKYRFSKVSALGFAARVYLYMGNWDKAIEYAKKAYDICSDLEDFNSADAKLPVSYQSIENIFAMEQSFDNDVRNNFYISQKLIDAFNKDKDLRFAKFFKISGTNYQSTFGGYKMDKKVSMRTAEFYLILAESHAKSKNGDINSGKDYLKKLLIKRLAPDYYTTVSNEVDAMNKEEFIKYVEQERFRELACQGFRWFDLRRNGKPTMARSFDGQNGKLDKNDIRYILRFPTEAISANPNLRSNQ